MVVTCPRCRRSLSSVSAEGAPLFCMYCGQKLKEGSSAHDTRTGTFTPSTDPELSGVEDADPRTQQTPNRTLIPGVDVPAVPEPAPKGTTALTRTTTRTHTSRPLPLPSNTL